MYIYFNNRAKVMLYNYGYYNYNTYGQNYYFKEIYYWGDKFIRGTLQGNNFIK